MSLSHPSAGTGSTPRMVPAHLHFLAIYNPTLSKNESDEQNQILFYSAPDGSSVAETNEQLKQVGLAQGIVNLSAGFANGRYAESVDTEKRRIVVREVEPDWWILASVNLTMLPSARSDSSSEAPVEYSSREVSPAPLLLQQLTIAWRIFLLHHAASVQELYERLGRVRIRKLFDLYWSTFSRDWDVLLHGNPATDIYDGIKLSAGGELGVGVGEEEWGSGERDVLEDLVRNFPGCVDLVVSRFGEPAPSSSDEAHESQAEELDRAPEAWLGQLKQPGPTNGVIFSGVGKISRRSLRALSDWIRTVYTYGEETYGVLDNPSAGRIRKRRTGAPPPLPVSESTGDDPPGSTGSRNSESNVSKNSGSNTSKSSDGGASTLTPGSASSPAKAAESSAVISQDADMHEDRGQADMPTAVAPSIPRPIVTAAEDSLRDATSAANKDTSGTPANDASSQYTMSLGSSETWKKVLTLGYGSSWSIPGLQKENASDTGDRRAETGNASSDQAQDAIGKGSTEATGARQGPVEDGGGFLVGLRGNLNAIDDSGDTVEEGGLDSRVVKRLLQLDIESADATGASDVDCGASQLGITPSAVTPTTSAKGNRLSVVIYVHQPFIYAFIFEPNLSMLSLPGFYWDLRKRLRPLHKGLLRSTSPANVAARLQQVLPGGSVPDTAQQAPIYELLYNPYTLTVHSSIPNIPLPVSYTPDRTTSPRETRVPAPWTRVEALNVHSQVLQSFAETRRLHEDKEHQTKSNRGWWVVWMRLVSANTDPQTRGLAQNSSHGFREAVLVRKAVDKASSSMLPSQRRSSGFGMGRFLGLDSGNSGNKGGGPSPLTEGVGVDAKKYVESLLSLNR